jgi:hypothetical protein
MRKYAKLTLAVSAVVLLTASQALSRGPHGGGGHVGPAVERMGPSASGHVGPTTHGPRTQPYQPNFGGPTHVMSTGSWAGNPVLRMNSSQFRQHLSGLAGTDHPTSSWPTNRGQWQQQASQIRGNVHGRYNHLFTPQWYAQHPNAWHALHPHANVWAVVTWPALANWIGYASGDAPYDYGTVYESTYYFDENEETAPQVGEDVLIRDYQDPAELAGEGLSGATATDPNQWLPLGVFAVSMPGSTTTPNRLFQFAVNKNGQIAGSYYDAMSDQSLPIQGAIQKDTQRAAWTVGSNKTSVWETNLGGFTENHSTVLLHSGNSQTEKWMMVRLEDPTSGQTDQTNPQGNTNQTNPQGNTNQNTTTSGGTTPGGTN